MAELTRHWRPENRERSEHQANGGTVFAHIRSPDLRLF